MRRAARWVIASCALIGVAAQAQYDPIDWSPTDFETLRSGVLRWAEASDKPILGLTLRPDHFADDIGRARVVYLDLSSRASATRTDLALLAPVQNQVVHIATDEIFFREQRSPSGEAFRHLRTRWELNCEQGLIGITAMTWYRDPPSGEVVSVDRLPNQRADLAEAQPGSFNALVLNGVCEEAYLYKPR